MKFFWTYTANSFYRQTIDNIFNEFYFSNFRCNGQVNHCIIYATERGFGFAEPYNIHKTLKHLVLHYAQNSLEEHNESLTTTLAYPTFASPASLAKLQAQQRQLLIQQAQAAAVNATPTSASIGLNQQHMHYGQQT